MKKKVFTMILAVLCAFSFAQAATYSGGLGTPADPYQISSAADWETLSLTPADWGQSFRLTTNITVNNIGPIGIPGNPILGTPGTPFTGTFDGDGKGITYNYSAPRGWATAPFGNNSGTITNLTVNGTIAAVESFPALGSGWVAGIVAVNTGTISDLSYNGTISLDPATSGDGTYNVYVGGIVAENRWGAVSDCSFNGYIGGSVYDVYAAGIAGANTGTIDGASVGGFATVFVAPNYNFTSTTFTVSGAVAGYNGGTITDTEVDATVIVDNQAWAGFMGGFVGYNEGDITGSSSMADVFFGGVQGVVGGFCGWNYGTITDSLVEGVVTVAGSGSRIGGFVGVNSGSGGQGDISKSYFFGNVDFVNNGSNVGLFAGTNTSGADINNSFAIGNLDASPNKVLAGVIAGGFAGVNDTASTITNSYAVDKDAKTVPPYYYDNATFVGGVAGFVESGTLTGTVWNQSTSGLASGVDYGSAAGTLAKTTAEMKLQATFTAEGWDFATIWGMSAAGSQFEGYPIFTTAPAPDTQVINLTAGWNWVSFNVLPADTTVQNVLAGYSASWSNNDTIIGQTTAEGSATYYTAMGIGWYSAPQMHIQAGKMYKIRVTNPGTITVQGVAVDPGQTVVVNPGYNWIGYNPQAPAMVQDALQYYAADNNDSIIGQSTAQGSATYYTAMGIGWYSAPQMYLEPGRGYVLYSLQGNDFSYTTAIAANSKGEEAKTGGDPDAPAWVDMGTSLYSKSVDAAVFVTLDAMQIATTAGSMVSAWIGDVCVGVNKDGGGNIIAPVMSPIAGKMYIPFQIAGEAGLQVTFKVYDFATKNIYDCQEVFTYNDTVPYGSMPSLNELTVQAATTTWTVTFVAGDNGTITAGDATQTVDDGGAAVAPTITPNDGWVFDGWDTDFSNVTGNLMVTAQYNPATYTVTFDAQDGTAPEPATISVTYGQAYGALASTTKAGHTFAGWWTTAETGGTQIEELNIVDITSDHTLYARWTLNLYSVMFTIGSNGTHTGGGSLMQMVPYGSAAVAPDVTPNTGWVFDGWDEDFSNITGDLTVTAQYSVETFTVTFDLDGKGTRTGGGELVQTVNYGDAAIEPIFTVDSNWVFTGWNEVFSNITADLTVTAQYVLAGPTTWTVTFDLDGKGTRTGGGQLSQIVNDGDAAIAPQVAGNAGWVFTGWDVDFDNITTDLTVTAQYSVATFTVTFDGGDNGSLIGDTVQIVNYGDGVTNPPAVIPKSGYVFTGWSPSIDNVTGDISPVATYAEVDRVACAEVDINYDGFVDLFDLSLFMEQWLNDADATEQYLIDNPTVNSADFDNNEWVHLADYVILSVDCWGYGEQIINLQKGWNWISFYVLPDEPVISTVLADFVPAPTDNDRIIGQTTAEGSATYYTAAGLGWYSYPEMNVSYGKMYKVYVDNPDGAVVTVQGKVVDPDMAITINPGFNWLGYNIYNVNSVKTSDVLENYAALNNDKIIGQTTAEGSSTYYTASGLGWYSYPEMSLQRGKGYVFYTSNTQPTNFTYGDWSQFDGQQGGEPLSITDKPSGSKAPPSWVDNGSSLYSKSVDAAVYVVFDAGAGEAQIATAAGSMVSAWINHPVAGNVCVGVNKTGAGLVITPVMSPIAGIAYIPFNIAGEAGLNVTFKVYDAATDTEYSVDETFSYSDLAPYGSMPAPQKLTAKSLLPNYTVTFDAGTNGAITAGVPVQVVPSGTAATAPTVTANAGLVHYGWDSDFSNVTSDMTVTAQYHYDLPGPWLPPVGGVNLMTINVGEVEKGGVALASPPKVGDAIIAYDSTGAVIGLTVNDVTNPAYPLANFDLVMTSNSDNFPITYKYFDATTNEEFDLVVADASGAETFINGVVHPVVKFEVVEVKWFEQYTALPPSNWTVAGGDFVSGATGTMTGSGISSAPIDVSAFTDVTFDVQTDTGAYSYLIFGITDNAGVYHMVGYWSGVTPVTPVTVNLAPYTAAGNTIAFHWTYSKGKFAVGADTVWVWNFQLN